MRAADDVETESEEDMTAIIMAYRVDHPEDDRWEPEYICVRCYEDGSGGDWYEDFEITAITDPAEMPDGPSGLGRECDSPFCEDRLPRA